MRVTNDVVRLGIDLVRRADAGLATGAARNAAVSMQAHHALEIDARRALRDLNLVIADMERIALDAVAR